MFVSFTLLCCEFKSAKNCVNGNLFCANESSHKVTCQFWWSCSSCFSQYVGLCWTCIENVAWKDQTMLLALNSSNSLVSIALFSFFFSLSCRSWSGSVRSLLRVKRRKVAIKRSFIGLLHSESTNCKQSWSKKSGKLPLSSKETIRVVKCTPFWIRSFGIISSLPFQGVCVCVCVCVCVSEKDER